MAHHYDDETEARKEAIWQAQAQAQQNQIGSAVSGLATHGGLFSNQLCVFKLDGNLIGEGRALPSHPKRKKSFLS